MNIQYFLKSKAKKIKIALILTSISAILMPVLCTILKSQKVNADEQNEKFTVELPVIMYHLILKNPKNKNKFTIAQSTFEEDLKYIKSNGYTTVSIKNLIDFTEGKENLPPKPILLTFDDGAYNNYLYAFPLAKKYKAKFVFSPIAHETEKFSEIDDENPNYSHANWDQIKEMSDSGLVEIQNHTYNMHSRKKPRIGCTKKFGESDEAYEKNLSQDIKKSQDLIEQHTGKRPCAFFYPFGARGKNSEKIIKSLGFKATFVCESKVNKLTIDPNCLYSMGRFLRTPNMSSEKFFSQFEDKIK